MAAKKRAEHRRTVKKDRRRASRMTAGPGLGGRLLTALTVIAAVIFGTAVFFRVRSVEVRGNAVYSASSVEEASGLEVGQNLLTLNRAAAAGRIRVELPYVEQVRVTRVLPDKIVLDVTETGAVFSVHAENDSSWLMDFTGKVIELVSDEEAANHPSVEGVRIAPPTPGLPASSADAEALSAAVGLLGELRGTGLTDSISRIDVSKPYDLVMWYGTQYEVKLGGTDQMDYKLKYLQAVLEQLYPTQTGTIDLTLDGERVGRFIPW